jgi:hypothetical protein
LKLAAEVHPDKRPGAGQKELEDRKRKFVEVQEAYEVCGEWFAGIGGVFFVLNGQTCNELMPSTLRINFIRTCLQRASI